MNEELIWQLNELKKFPKRHKQITVAVLILLQSQFEQRALWWGIYVATSLLVLVQAI
jgi:hypothetical protein